MLDPSRVWIGLCIGLLSACAAQEPRVAEPAPAPPVARPSQAPSAPPAAAVDEASRAEEAKAMLAQAETDVQRARAKRALWLNAWEALVSARQAATQRDHEAVIRHARRASEFAQLGLEQLAYPAVR